MANRDLSNFREVTSVVPEAPNSMFGIIGELGQKAVTMHQEAKINENLSAAQLELSQLDNQYRIDNEANPFDAQAIGVYKKNRQDIIGKYGSDISSMFMGDFDAGANKLVDNSDTTMQNWGFKQSEVNTVRSIDNMAQNNFAMMAQSGSEYGRTAEGDLALLLNFEDSKQRLVDFGLQSGAVGESTMQEMSKNYEAEAAQYFLNGVVRENPALALKLLDDPKIQNIAAKTKGWGEYRTALENQALDFQDVAIKKEVLGKMKSNNDLFNTSSTLSYNEFQQVSAGMSDPAKEYFAKISGFTKGEAASKLTLAEQVSQRDALFSKVQTIMSAEGGIELNTVREAQNEIFTGLNNKSLSKEEGQVLMRNLLGTVVGDGGGEIKDMKGLEDYTNRKYFSTASGSGFKQIENFADGIELKVSRKDPRTLKDTKKLANTNNKAQLYTGYLESLNIEAAKLGFNDISQLQGLDREKRGEVFEKAATNTINTFKANNTPLGIRANIPLPAIKELIAEPTPENQKLIDKLFGTGAANRILNGSK